LDATHDRSEILDELAPGVRPEMVDGVEEARAILPIFRLVRSLFSTSETDTTLKLVVLFALAQAEGRFSRERVRSLVRSLSSERLDALVTSLHSGGWLELRAMDNTYRLAPMGLYLLAVLRAANFASQNPANLLVRAAEALAFGDRVDAEGQTTSRLLGMLLAELESQAARAREIIRLGRPRLLVRFSREAVRQQIAQVIQVVAAVEERLDQASDHFGRVVRLHEAMQRILRAHEGIGRRLAEWNMRKLETTDAGYSLTALCDAVMGASAEELMTVVKRGALHLPVRAAALSTGEVQARYRAARPRVREALERFVYRPPPEPRPEPMRREAIDPVARLRAALEERIRDLLPGEALPLEAWLADGELARDFTDAVLQINLLCRMEGCAPRGEVELGPGVSARIEQTRPDPAAWRDLCPGEALAALEQLGALQRIRGLGLHPALRLERAGGEEAVDE